MEATKMAETMINYGIPVINIVGSRYGIDGMVEVSELVHVQVSAVSDEVNVVVKSADGEEF